MYILSLTGLNRRKALYSIKCSGDELRLQYCHHETEETGRCRYYEMASVECSECKELVFFSTFSYTHLVFLKFCQFFSIFLLIDAPDIVMDYREMKKSMFIESRYLYELSCAYEEKCLSSTASHYIRYPHVFQRTLIRFTSRFWNRGTSDFVTNVNKDDWEWHDCHAHYHSMERFSDYDLIGEYPPILFLSTISHLRTNCILVN